MVRYRSVPKSMLQYGGGLSARNSNNYGTQQEMKHKDINDEQLITGVTKVLVGNTGNSLHPSQGSGPQMRIGREHIMKKISGNIEVIKVTQEQVEVSFAGPVSLRLVLAWDKQANGIETTEATANKLFEFSDTRSFRNLEWVKRFKVLWEKSMLLTSSAGAYNGNVALGFGGSRRFSFNIPLNIKTRSINGSGDFSACADNKLIFFAHIDIPSQCLVKFHLRLRFTDP